MWIKDENITIDTSIFSYYTLRIHFLETLYQESNHLLMIFTSSFHFAHINRMIPISCKYCRNYFFTFLISNYQGNFSIDSGLLMCIQKFKQIFSRITHYQLQGAALVEYLNCAFSGFIKIICSD